MRLGTAQVDITPPVGRDMSGFAARTQPSIGVLDRLFGKSLFLQQDDAQLLWIGCDLLGLPREFVQQFRNWVADNLRLRAQSVIVSCTHTHAGPATVVLHEAGEYDRSYMEWLLGRLQEVAAAALTDVHEYELVTAEGCCDLAIDRRHKASAHTDPRVGAVGWRRIDGTFAAVLVNYAMHAVALGPANRLFSADWPGRTAAVLSRELPGNPLVLVTNGACGNLNPPAENIAPEQLEEWGGLVASAVLGPLRDASPIHEPAFRVKSQIVPLPLDALSVEGIERYATASLRNVAGIGEWGEKFRRAIDAWRRNMTAAVTDGRIGEHTDVELFTVRLADRFFVGVNAEVFSTFARLVAEQSGAPVYTIGYANGDAGYIPTSTAYEEGGYEVEMAHLFYDAFRFKRGGLEALAAQAAKCVADL